jgi:glycerol-3-phosphate dehydrogenase
MSPNERSGAPYDLAIVGGGINGCGIARDAAGRGYSVYLCEAGDLANGTSSSSTKLIHGGLRYLEYYEFRLVREALMEREVLWSIAPHIVRPLRFVLPLHRGLRPAWFLRLGLYLYDHIGGRRRLPATATLDLATAEEGRPLKPGTFTKAFAYADCWVDDARLVVLNARDAADRGATIATRTALVAAERRDGAWAVTVRDRRSGATHVTHARALVNAAGPWAANVLACCGDIGPRPRTRLVQGSHIVVPKLFDHAASYIFQNADGRIVFAIPYERDFTLIGTTDRDFTGDPYEAAITPGEIAYLCEAASAYFVTPIAPADIVWTYAGVRGLVDDGATAAQAATRDYVLDVDAPPGAAPMLTIFGGKITTYRRLAEQALAKLDPHLSPADGLTAGWTGRAPLPGGDFATDATAFAALVARLRSDFPFLDAAAAERYARAYGTRASAMLGGATSAADLGRDFGASLTEAEIAYLRRHEWADTAEDVLWRRSKLGLHMTADERRAVADHMAGLTPP